MVSTSTTAVPEEPATWRRPLTSTRVRTDPRPRRSSCVPPSNAPLVADKSLLVELNSAGTYWIMSPADVLPDSVRTSLLNVVTGAADSSSGRAMRDPVTMIEASSSSSFADAASCALTTFEEKSVAVAAMPHSARAVALKRNDIIAPLVIQIDRYSHSDHQMCPFSRLKKSSFMIGQHPTIPNYVIKY